MVAKLLRKDLRKHQHGGKLIDKSYELNGDYRIYGVSYDPWSEEMTLNVETKNITYGKRYFSDLPAYTIKTGWRSVVRMNKTIRNLIEDEWGTYFEGTHGKYIRIGKIKHTYDDTVKVYKFR
jgi:hypothetical protein